MNILCQKNYIAQVKNTMLLHFNHKDIKSTLKDLNELFESGKESGKTEEELCNELGKPKDFVFMLLHDNYHDKFAYRLFAYLASALVICVVITYIFKSLNPAYWCIPTAIIPAYIWHLCGGSCLFEFQNSAVKYKILYMIMNVFALILIVVQQFLALLLNNTEKIAFSNNLTTLLRITYYLSMILITIFILFSSFIIYQMLYGDYLSLSILLLSIGTICSSLSYIIYIRSFNEPNTFASICSLPYVLSIILFLIFFPYLRKKGVK